MAVQRFFFFSFFLLCAIWSVAQDSSTVNYNSLQKKIAANNIDFKALSQRLKMVWNDGKSQQEFQATIRMKRDSLIWMSAGSMGVEGMRTLFTIDSIFIINRLSQEYVTRSFDYIQNWLLLPVNFSMLQQIILGEKMDIHTQAVVAALEGAQYVIYEENDKLKQTTWVDTGNYTIRKILLKDKLWKQDMTITFDGYNSKQEKPFSTKRNITITRDELRVELGMEVLKISAEGEFSFPFEVNEKYKRTE